MTHCYRDSYLKRVVIRIDFSSQVNEIFKGLPKKSADLVLKSFPIPEPKEVISKHYEFGDTGAKETQTKQNHLYYFGKNREKSVCITPDFAALDIVQYASYPNTKKDFELLIEALSKSFDFSIKRIGVRYINNIAIPGLGVSGWNEYVSEKLVSAIDFSETENRLIRCFSSRIERFSDDMMLNFQFGIHNPDFPSYLKQNQFILDFDAYYQGIIESDDAAGMLDTAHGRIEDAFEKSINEKLRQKMILVQNDE